MTFGICKKELSTVYRLLGLQRLLLTLVEQVKNDHENWEQEIPINDDACVAG